MYKYLVESSRIIQISVDPTERLTLKMFDQKKERNVEDDLSM
jgi:hypothetical protein